MLKHNHLGSVYNRQVFSLYRVNKQRFPKWNFILKSGFNQYSGLFRDPFKHVSLYLIFPGFRTIGIACPM